eukprot:gene7487-8276_t
MSSLEDMGSISSNLIIPHSGDFAMTTFNHHLLLAAMGTGGEEVIGYSNLSLYFTLFLYILSVPGLFSLISRSVKSKPVQKIYDMPGPANPTAKPLRQLAGEVMAYFKTLNYQSSISEELITFKGVIGRSNSQAFFLTFCTFLALGSAGLILSILLPDVGNNAYYITLLSPYAGIYYWKNAQREDVVTVKMETSDDDQTTSLIATGEREELDRLAVALKLAERGKVYVKGIFEDGESPLPNTSSDAKTSSGRSGSDGVTPSTSSTSLLASTESQSHSAASSSSQTLEVDNELKSEHSLPRA